MTDDFIEDAIDSLEKGDLGYILIAANFSSPKCHTATNIPTMEHLQWMKRRFDEVYEDLFEKLNNN